MTTNQEYAKLSLRELVRHIYEHRVGLVCPMYYSDLAQRIGRTRPDGRGAGTGMGTILGLMGHLLEEVEDDWGEPIPQIQSLVVLKTGPYKGLPDDGIAEFWSDYPKLTLHEKTNKAQIEYQKIAEFGSRWNDVLETMGLSLPQPKLDGFPKGAGESERHRALKKYVKDHPEVMGLTNIEAAFIEYPLPSLDSIDVLFKLDGGCLAVEVKSIVSDQYLRDYERGIFQVVKYRSLLSAMTQVSGYSISGKVEAVLVLESSLPKEYRNLADRLGVSVIENIKAEN